jgi:hypothetical protein
MKDQTQALEVIPQGGALTAPVEQLSITQVFQAVMKTDISPEKVAVMKELLAMSAEQQFNTAFVKLQSELPVVVASSIIPNRGKYERYEDLLDKDGIGELLARNNFSVSFSQDFKDSRIIVTCFLSHAGGHTRPNSFACRVGGRSDSETQADSKASTTAKRNAFCQALNIVIRQDCLNEGEDAGIEGNPNAFITLDQSEELARRVQLVNASIPAFLEFAKAKKFSEIQASRYDELDRLLARKEKGGK